MKVLTLYLTRTYLKKYYTIGNLYCVGVDLSGKNSRLIENQFLCNILEDTFRGNDLAKCKIPGKTCIPEGSYIIKMTYSPRFKKDLPQLLNVPFFTGIRIHSGNNAEHSEGCLLPGMNKAVGQVLESKYHTDIIINKIKQYDICSIIVKNI